MKQFLIFTFSLLLATTYLNAQNSDKKWAIGAHVGLNHYFGDLREATDIPPQYPYIFEELSFSRYLSPSFDLGLFGSYGHYGYWITGKAGENFRAFKTQGSLLLKYKLANGYILSETSKLIPFVTAGAGIAGYADRAVTDGTDIILPMGAGLTYQISKSIAFQYTALYNFTNSDKRDFNEVAGSSNDQFLAHTLGVVFSFGPKKKESKANKDSDGDGIPDRLDKCPNEFGVAANKGCPEVQAETKQIFDEAITGIQFETAKDVIRESSFPILNQVVKVMNNNKNYDLEINGHTDNQGDANMNLELSKKRAESVKRYLVEKGIAESRLTTNGYGQTKPIADNETPEGRAKNRRVEFKVIF